VNDAPCLWGFSKAYEFDPRIPVPDWPPKDAAFVAAEQQRGSDGIASSSIELALEGGLYDLAGQARIRKAYPHLEAGEMVLYIRAHWDGTRRQGALRLQVVGEDGTGYRYTNYTPLQSMEDDRSSRFRRAIWFERENASE
jgi:hypothetical protein